jgi:hypothetical protein
MRTLTAIALAIAMLFTVANGANATTTHKKKKQHHSSSTSTKKPKTENETKPAADKK